MTARSAARLPWHWTAAVLALALILRVVGIDHGQPFWLVNDELPLIGGALRMLELRNPIPSMNPGPMAILYYPPGLPWLYLVAWAPVLALQWVLSGFEPLQVFADRLVSDLTPIWLMSRLISVAFSVGTVWVVMRLAADVLKDRLAGLTAGLLLATSFHHGLLGHFARAWAPTVFFFWWGLWATWRIFEDGKNWNYASAALAAGLGFAVNYVGVLISLGVALAHVARHRRIVIDRAIFLHALIVALFLAVIMAASWPNFLRLMGYSGILASLPGALDKHGTLEAGSMLGFYAVVLWNSDLLLMIVGLIGLPFLARKAPLFIGLLLVVFVPYAIMILTGYSNDDRYVLPLTPGFAIAAAALVTIARPAPRRVVVAAIAFAVLIQAALLARLDYLMLRPDTRLLARAWIEANVTSDQGVISAMRGVPFEQSLNAVMLEQEMAPGAISYLQRRRLSGANLASGGGGRQIDAIHIRQIGPEAVRSHSPEQLLDRLTSMGYRWFIADDLSGPVGDGQFEKMLLERAKLVATFDSGSDRRFGPIFNLTNQFERGSSFDVFRLERLGPAVKVYRFE